MRRVGILGGMGPAATILLQQRILEATTVSRDDGHLPLLIDMNPQVPSRIDYLIHAKGQNPGPVLASMASALQSNGVAAIAMPCCTAHHFAHDIEASISIPFLNVLELLANQLMNVVSSGASVGLLASPATEKIGLFKEAFMPYGLAVEYPADSAAMLDCIESIKRQGVHDEHVQVLQTAIRELEDRGTAALVVGCSEFSLLSRQLSSPLPVIDAMDMLAQSIIGFASES